MDKDTGTDHLPELPPRLESATLASVENLTAIAHSEGIKLADIQESIVRIERYTSQGRAAFDQDELIQTWVVHHLQIIGEASRGISHSLRDKYPAVPWIKIIGMRNILVHLYFGIDKEIVGLSWNVTCLISSLRLRLFFANWENSTSLFSFSCCRQLPAPPH